MDNKFQDEIDRYLLDRMDDAEKTRFLSEVEQDEGKKEQLEFTRNVKDSIRSRKEKLQALSQFQKQYEEKRKATAMRATGTDTACYCAAPEMKTKPVLPKRRLWLWISSAAAVLIVGFLVIKPMFISKFSPNCIRVPMEKMRGGDEVFSPVPQQDSTDCDTIQKLIDKKAKTGDAKNQNVK